MQTNCYTSNYMSFILISKRLSTVKKKNFDKKIEKKITNLLTVIS